MVNWPFVVDILIYSTMISFEDKYRGFQTDFSRWNSGIDSRGIPLGLDWFLDLPDCFKKPLIQVVTKYSNEKEHTGFFCYDVYIINDKKLFREICNCLSVRYDFIYLDIPSVFTPTVHFLNINSLTKTTKLYINRALVPYIREYKNVI